MNEVTRESRDVEVELPNGVVAYVRARQLGGGAEKVSWPDRFHFDGVSGALEGIAEAIQSGVAKVNPSKVSVELGLELGIKSGKLVGLIVDGEGQASLTITLEWDDRRAPA